MSKSPDLSPGKAALRAARTERLAQALRENLKRRKQRADAPVKGAADIDGHSATLSGGVVSSKSDDRSKGTAD
jgi:hypothetical protein